MLAESSADGSLQLSGAADSRLARGLVALLVRGLQREPPSVLRTLSVPQLASSAGLHELLTPSRLNGLEAMVRVMSTQLEQQQQQAAMEEAEDTVDAVEAAETAQAAEAAEPAEVAGAASLTMPEGHTLDASAQPQLLWPSASEEVALLLSGGVDSSVALHELLAAGHRVRAFYLVRAPAPRSQRSRSADLWVVPASP